MSMRRNESRKKKRKSERLESKGSKEDEQK